MLARFVTPGLVDEVVAEAGAELAGRWPPRAGRRAAAVPGDAGRLVYFVLGLCLYSHLPYAEVVKELASGLRRALAEAGWRVPATTALTGLRRRLGARPFELLFTRLSSALSPGGGDHGRISAGCWRWRGTAPRSRPPRAPRISPRSAGSAAIITRGCGW